MSDGSAAEQQRERRRRSVNIIIGSMAFASVMVSGLAIYFYLTGTEVVAYVMLAYSLLMIPFLFWFRKRLLRQPPTN